MEKGREVLRRKESFKEDGGTKIIEEEKGLEGRRQEMTLYSLTLFTLKNYCKQNQHLNSNKLNKNLIVIFSYLIINF